MKRKVANGGREPAGGPEPLAEIVSRLFAARGWGRRQARLHLEAAWREVVGEDTAAKTRPAAFRHGVLEVTVEEAILLQELAHFRKQRVLQELRKQLPGTRIEDVRFRLGTIE